MDIERVELEKEVDTVALAEHQTPFDLRSI